MEIRVIAGRRATDRRGAAERTGWSLSTVAHLAADRDRTGFPSPIEVDEIGRGVRARGSAGTKSGREWYDLEHLDAFKAAYDAELAAARQARVHGEVSLDGDDDELLTGQECAAELKVEYDTWRSWVRDSKAAWDEGRDGYLPRPDKTEPARRGVTRYWRRGTLRSFIRNRPGRGAGAGRPKANAAAVR